MPLKSSPESLPVGPLPGPARWRLRAAGTACGAWRATPLSPASAPTGAAGRPAGARLRGRLPEQRHL
ncbi:hypothetical protein DES46_110135 [Caldimonas thermodepolymerans]|nr:hypothetical protein DES46_110135 [Caldimonas thermodepolymerans]